MEPEQLAEHIAALKKIAVLAILLTIVGVIVALVDYQTKRDIIKEAKALREAGDAYAAQFRGRAGGQDQARRSVPLPDPVRVDGVAGDGAQAQQAAAGDEGDTPGQDGGAGARIPHRGGFDGGGTGIRPGA